MNFTRREFLVFSGAAGAGIALTSLGVDMGPAKALCRRIEDRQDEKSEAVHDNLLLLCGGGAGSFAALTPDKARSSISKETRIILSTRGPCAQKARHSSKPQRTIPAACRKYCIARREVTSGKKNPGDWALERIAKKVKATRDAHFMEKNAKGETVNRVETIAHVGSAALDNEEVWHPSDHDASTGARVHRTPGTHMTQRYGCGSGRVVRTRRNDQSLD